MFWWRFFFHLHRLPLFPFIWSDLIGSTILLRFFFIYPFFFTPLPPFHVRAFFDYLYVCIFPSLSPVTRRARRVRCAVCMFIIIVCCCAFVFSFSLVLGVTLAEEPPTYRRQLAQITSKFKSTSYTSPPAEWWWRVHATRASNLLAWHPYQVLWDQVGR